MTRDNHSRCVIMSEGLQSTSVQSKKIIPIPNRLLFYQIPPLPPLSPFIDTRNENTLLIIFPLEKAMSSAPIEAVQTYGRKKTATAVAHCKRGSGQIKLNGVPLELVQPEILKFKVFEPILLLGKARFAGVDIRIRVKGGGVTSQIYAIRQAIAKAIVAFNQKCEFL